ncbi:hypothetical protein [Paraglaciecola sp. 2405UD69-4]|uniref:hypothetical protein n=1 Tax=Paraglaciecola sp. 2405UD69-4 TaxID=3391836 RepID=UPI0039C8DBB1
MRILDVFSSGTESESPHYLAVLMSDGEVDGKHSLTVIGQFDNNEFEQQVFSWTSGIPQSLVHGSFIGIRPGDQTRKYFAVVTKSPGHVLVFENIIPDGARIGETPVYSEPVSFDIEDGAGSAVTAYEDFILKTIEQGDVIYISYPDTGVVRSYTPSFEALSSVH